jgi:hypothetical protein
MSLLIVFTIWDSYWDIGSPNQHMQQLVINYEIPLIKSHYLALLRLIIPIRVITMAEIIKCIFSVKDIGIPDLGIRFKTHVLIT